MKSLGLAELQQQFKDVVKDKSDRLDGMLTPRDDHAKRLHIYQYAFAARLSESLEEDFDQVRIVLGADHFGKLVEKYMTIQTSRSWTVAEYSEAFPDFLRTQIQEKYIFDLAEFEWLKIKCSLGASAQFFDPQTLIHVTEAEWVMAKMKIVSSMMVFSSYWPVNAPQLLIDYKPLKKLFYYALFRSPQGLKVLELNSIEMDLLEEMTLGKSFSELAHNYIEKGIPVEQVGAAVGAWVQEGLIEKVVFDDTKIS